MKTIITLFLCVLLFSCSKQDNIVPTKIYTTLDGNWKLTTTNLVVSYSQVTNGFNVIIKNSNIQYNNTTYTSSTELLQQGNYLVVDCKVSRITLYQPTANKTFTEIYVDEAILNINGSNSNLTKLTFKRME